MSSVDVLSVDAPVQMDEQEGTERLFFIGIVFITLSVTREESAGADKEAFVL